MREPIKVRFAISSDASELSKLNNDFNGVLIIERLETDDEYVVVALKNNEIIGFACAQKKTTYVGTLGSTDRRTDNTR